MTIEKMLGSMQKTATRLQEPKKQTNSRKKSK